MAGMTVKVTITCDGDGPAQAEVPMEVAACLENLAGLVDAQADYGMREAEFEEELGKAEAMVSDRPSLEHLQQMVARAIGSQGIDQQCGRGGERNCPRDWNENATSYDLTMGDGLCGNGNGGYHPMGCADGELRGPGRGEVGEAGHRHGAGH